MPVVIRATIRGAADLEKRLARFEDQFRVDLQRRFSRYTKRQLVNRIKERLRKSTDSKIRAVGPDGVAKPQGGYGAEPNAPKYAEWKKTVTNLPLVGGVETTTMISTGYLRQSIAHVFTSKGGHYMKAEVGPIDSTRPGATPFKESAPGVADTSRVVSNETVAAEMEEKYKFMTSESEDARKDAHVLVVKTIERTLKRLFSK